MTISSNPSSSYQQVVSVCKTAANWIFYYSHHAALTAETVLHEIRFTHLNQLRLHKQQRL